MAWTILATLFSRPATRIAAASIPCAMDMMEIGAASHRRSRGITALAALQRFHRAHRISRLSATMEELRSTGMNPGITLSKVYTPAPILCS
jgi:hypothetical protein